MIEINRESKETNINLKLDIYGDGDYDIKTKIGFFDHMLELWSKHGFFDIELEADGDLEVDEHHTVEDVGIVLGQGIKRQLGDRSNIRRYGDIIIPMDETLVMVVIDLSGRSYYHDDLNFTRTSVGGFPVELFKEFFRALTNNGEFTLHFKMINGGNTHHLMEACFKGFGRALDRALKCEKRLKGKPLSTKGSLKEGGYH